MCSTNNLALPVFKTNISSSEQMNTVLFLACFITVKHAELPLCITMQFPEIK